MRKNFWYIYNQRKNSVFVFPDNQIEFDSKEAAERRLEAFFRPIKEKDPKRAAAFMKEYRPMFGSYSVREKAGRLIDDFMKKEE